MTQESQSAKRRRLTRNEVDALAESVGRMLDEIRDGRLAATASMVCHLEGAAAALNAVRGGQKLDALEVGRAITITTESSRP